MNNTIMRPDTTVFRIEKGYGRFSMGIDKDTGEGVMIFSCSDKRAPDLGANVKLPEGETTVSVMGLALSDYRQAEAYAEAFHLLANQMRLRAKLN